MSYQGQSLRGVLPSKEMQSQILEPSWPSWYIYMIHTYICVCRKKRKQKKDMFDGLFICQCLLTWSFCLNTKIFYQNIEMHWKINKPWNIYLSSVLPFFYVYSVGFNSLLTYIWIYKETNTYKFIYIHIHVFWKEMTEKKL